MSNKETHHVLSFCRSNPPTAGHVKVFNKVKEIADKHNASHGVILSHSHDPKKNPLSPEDKVKYAKKMAPGVNIEHSTKEAPTVMHHAAKAHDAGVKHLHVVVGSDRVEEFKTLLHKYHGPDSKKPFKSVTVHSAGERDPDAEGVSGISGTKMRDFASKNDHESFHKGVGGHLSKDDSHGMMKAVRKGMQMESNIIDEAIKIGSVVKMHHPGRDYHGKSGVVGEIRHGAYKGAPKTYTVDYTSDQGHTQSIQLDKKNIKSATKEKMHESFREYISRIEEENSMEGEWENLEEAEYQGRKVTLNKPFYTPDGPKKSAVYVKNSKGNVIKVTFGDPNMEIKADNPERKKSFRARHNCDDKNDPTTAGYWSCKAW